MDRAFSVAEISEQFWSTALPAQSNSPDESSKMNRSESEWAFQRFLQEEAHQSSSSAAAARGVTRNDSVVEIENKNDDIHQISNGGKIVGEAATGAVSFDAPQNSEEYQAFLKSKLNLACAAVALTRGTCVKSQNSAARADSGSQASNNSELGSQAPKGH